MKLARPLWMVSVLMLVGASSSTPVFGIFADDFESGDTSAWSTVVGLAPKAFRFSDLDLRDPHLFVEVDVVVTVCLDFTDEPLPVVNFSFNGDLETQITTDGDGDDFLDLSSLLLFRPLDRMAMAERVDFAAGDCLAPLESTICAANAMAAPAELAYDGVDAGSCLDVVAGTTSGYSPAIETPTTPCFVTIAESLPFQLGDLEITLEDLQVAATLVGDPIPTSLTGGLLRGFLSETAADTVLIPDELPLVGGQPLSTLLPGGTGNCAEGDDRDMHEGVTGWWFYFNFQAERATFFGG
ncbi:MAG: hypothetical protein AAF560_15035 [Acidobacteriota bacterium]